MGFVWTSYLFDLKPYPQGGKSWNLREIWIDPLVPAKTRAKRGKKRWFLPAPDIEKDLKMRLVIYTLGFPDDVDFSEGVRLRGLFWVNAQIAESPDHPGLKYIQLYITDKRNEITDPESLTNVKKKLVITYMNSEITKKEIIRSGILMFPIPGDRILYAGKYMKMDSDDPDDPDDYHVYMNLYYSYITEIGQVGHVTYWENYMKINSMVDYFLDPQLVFML